MRMPRFRFTMRGLMIAVAVVGVLIWIVWDRAGAKYRETAYLYRTLADKQWTGPPLTEEQASVRQRRFQEYTAEMARKYERAARYPWLPVEPDTPEP